jgi:hypothetical protein
MTCDWAAQKTTLSTLGILDRFIDRARRADCVEAEHGICPSTTCIRHVLRELENGNIRNEKEGYSGKEKSRDYKPRIPTSRH